MRMIFQLAGFLESSFNTNCTGFPLVHLVADEVCATTPTEYDHEYSATEKHSLLGMFGHQISERITVF